MLCFNINTVRKIITFQHFNFISFVFGSAIASGQNKCNTDVVAFSSF